MWMQKIALNCWHLNYMNFFKAWYWRVSINVNVLYFAAHIADWDSAATSIFLKVLKDHVSLIPSGRGNRKKLFSKAVKELASSGYSFSLDCIRMKFNSLLTSYKRIKLKIQQDGKVKSRWQFYEVKVHFQHSQLVLSIFASLLWVVLHVCCCGDFG